MMGLGRVMMGSGHDGVGPLWDRGNDRSGPWRIAEAESVLLCVQEEVDRCVEDLANGHES